MCERPAIAPDGREKPPEAEGGGIDTGAVPAARHQNYLAVPRICERRGRIEVCRARKRIDGAKLAAWHACREDSVLAVLHPNDGRHGHGSEALCLLPPQQARFEPDPRGSAHNVLADRGARPQAKIVRELKRVGSDAVIARNRYERVETRIGLRLRCRLLRSGDEVGLSALYVTASGRRGTGWAFRSGKPGRLCQVAVLPLYWGAPRFANREHARSLTDRSYISVAQGTDGRTSPVHEAILRKLIIPSFDS